MITHTYKMRYHGFFGGEVVCMGGGLKEAIQPVLLWIVHTFVCPSIKMDINIE
jgi:hypothetical protein